MPIKIQFKKIAIRAAILGLQALLMLGRACATFWRIIAPGVRRMVRFGGRITILPIYHVVLKTKHVGGKIFAPAHRALLLKSIQKYAAPIIFGFIFLFAGITNLYAQTTSAEDVGQGSILFSLIQGEEGETLGEIDIDFDDFVDEEGLATTEGGSALVKPTLITGERTSIAYHVVAPGDTLSSIATRYSIDITSILWANKMSVRDYIRPGNRLTIPPVSGVIHTIRKGDTVPKIAKFYNADAERILAFNHLGADATLSVGETLVVPGGKQPAPPAPRVRAVAPIARIIVPGAVGKALTKLLWPLPGGARITQYFSWRHSGVDLAMPSGNPVYAANDGIVVFSGWSRGYGNRVDIDHGDGTVTRYGHNSKNLVAIGDQVSRGGTIGLVGSTGRSTGPHVHFEVIASGRRVNPLKYIR